MIKIMFYLEMEGTKMGKQIWINKQYILKNAANYTKNIYSVLGFLGTFFTVTEIFNLEDHDIKQKAMVTFGLLLVLFLVCLIVSIIKFVNIPKIKVLQLKNDYGVYVQYGDVFSEEIIDSDIKKRNIVIPVNRCFDTLVDDDLVSSNTLHGITIKKLITEYEYTMESLNDVIAMSLSRQRIKYKSLSEKDKRKGKLNRYPVGSIAEIGTNGNENFFLLGLSTFNYDLKAETSIEEYVVAMQKMIEYSINRSQQYPVVFPLIGAGLSRTGKDEHSLLEYIIKLIKLNSEMINSDIYIVIRDSGKESIAITDLI